MPTYVYKFLDTGETIEVQQSFHDDTLTELVHPESGATLPVKKVFLPVGVTFRGDGFYKTDSRAAAAKSKSKPSTSDSGGSSGSTETKTSSDSSGSGDKKSSSSDSGTGTSKQSGSSSSGD